MPILTKRPDKTPLGIYIHVPFCRSKCQYCDFYSMASKDDKLVDGYLDAVSDLLKEAGELAPGYKVDTIYFGGGTPTFFGADGMAVVLSTIRRNFDVVADAEITFEANPDSVSDRLLHRLRAEGFNRVSLGIQNDNDEMLKKLGRPPYLRPGRHRRGADPPGRLQEPFPGSDVRFARSNPGRLGKDPAPGDGLESGAYQLLWAEGGGANHSVSVQGSVPLAG